MIEETARNKAIIKDYEKGLGARKLAKIYNLTPQRITAIIKRQRAMTMKV